LKSRGYDVVDSDEEETARMAVSTIDHVNREATSNMNTALAVGGLVGGLALAGLGIWSLLSESEQPVANQSTGKEGERNRRQRTRASHK